MIRFLLMLCAFAEGFLLWFLVALIRESRHLAPHTGKADRTRRGPVSRIGELIPMNPGTTQDENAGKTLGKRTALAVLCALLFALPLHGQQAAAQLTRGGQNATVQQAGPGNELAGAATFQISRFSSQPAGEC
jgi:hypothetical protein